MRAWCREGVSDAAGALRAAVQVHAGAGVFGEHGRGRRIVVAGALVDGLRLTHGYWEAKDDDLPADIQREFALDAIKSDQTQRKEGAR